MVHDDELIRPLPELLKRHAGRAGDQVAFSDSARGVTYGELERRTGKLAGHLAGAGLRRGDRVAVLLGNCVELVESCLAVTRASGVGVLLNPALPTRNSRTCWGTAAPRRSSRTGRTSTSWLGWATS